MTQLSVPHLLGTQNLTADDFQLIFDRVKNLVEDFETYYMEGETLIDFETLPGEGDDYQRVFEIFKILHEKGQHQLVQILRHEIGGLSSMVGSLPEK